ncbi:subunit of the TIM22-complex [Spathaspora passalidarum NRRL Y-27907]|uniref:Mitochondrial import inner membrane translocase subunit n=1 Tax=Spathaspora passalidarum (strain NRRL Y-27907 / 11-Y1) TaxID=619300 RepID=G3ASY2_SPAPN|nr:subunit of the TIM22-complex [Spathaspora passalidarum NRRL Y-27907]EGW30764.1 subunit of the TIM22-complex [Spathaspora passalidarum NRRL Y-27907]
MSLFLGNSLQYSQATVDPEKLKLAEVQFTATAHTFNKLLQSCANKCLVHEYGEGELSKGEQECIDRCAAKYVRANFLIGKHFQEQRLDPMSSLVNYEIYRK